jgi:hypothetical protein
MGFQFNSVGAMNEPIKDRIRDEAAAQVGVPGAHWQLGRDDRRADLVTVLDDFKQVLPLLFPKSRE